MMKQRRSLSFLISFGAVVFLGLSFLSLPSQNDIVAQANYQPGQVAKIDFVLPLPATYPLKRISLEEPVLTASAAAVLDRKSGIFLYQKNPSQALLPASTLKMMTALVVLDHYSLWNVLMVSEVSDEGQDMELVEGELVTVEALLYGLLISSANDAAEVLAKNYPGGRAKFIEAMNKKANLLGLEQSFFSNPTGLDSGEGERLEERDSFSTAKDLAWLADEGLKNEVFVKIVGTKEAVLRDPQTRFTHRLYNLNELLWTMPGVSGVKTGWTQRARECLVVWVQKEGKDLIFVVLGSEDRFSETRGLIDWVFGNFEWQPLQS